jgi:hypothetical protein
MARLFGQRARPGIFVTQPRGGARAKWIVLVLAVLALRLFLTHGHEVIDTVYDDYGYVHSGAGFYWGNPYDIGMNSRQPIMPLFVAASAASGLPFRLVLEVVFALAAASFGAGLARATGSRRIGAACFVVTALSPHTIRVFDRVLSDDLYVVLYLVHLAFLLDLVGRARRPLTEFRGWREPGAWGFAVSLALLWNTRVESALLVVPSGLAALSFAALSAGGSRTSLARAGRWLLPAVLCVATVTQGIAFANLERFGYFATSDLNAPGFKALNHALLRISTGPEGRFTAITKEARFKAYAVSPGLRRLRDYLEGPALDLYGPLSRQMGGSPQSHGPWWVWALKGAALANGLAGDGGKLDAYFQSCAKELDKALATGKLPARRSISSYLDPDTSTWLPYVGASVRGYLEILTSPADVTQIPNPPDTPPGIKALFDRVTHRHPPAGSWPGQSVAAAAGRALARGYGVLLALALPITFAALVALLLRWRRWRGRGAEAAPADLAFAACALVAVAAVERILFFALADAAGLVANGRYILPASVTLPAALIVALAGAWQAAPFRKARSSPSS